MNPTKVDEKGEKGHEVHQFNEINAEAVLLLPCVLIFVGFHTWLSCTGRQRPRRA